MGIRYRCSATAPLWLCLLMVGVGLQLLHALDPPSVEESEGIELVGISRQSETSLEITFEETDQVFAAFKTESAVNLSRAASAWTEVEGIEYEPLGERRFRATIPVNLQETRYFRIVGLGSAFDLDRDGLSNEDETNIHGTDPNDPDSDNDGFSDYIEVAQETNPNNGDQSPDYSVLPAVRFSLLKEVIEEGNYVHRIRLESDEAVFGSVNYTISALSTSDSESGGDLLLLSNEIDFSGGVSGAIDISLSDDAEIEDIEALIIDLGEAVDGNYRVGGVNQHILVIKDNDAFWTAQIIDGQSESSFRMLLTEEGSQTTGKIVSSIDNGSGVIPEGEWNLTVTRTDTTFVAVSEPIIIGDAFLLDTPMQRRFTVTVAPPEDTGPDAQYAYFLRSDRMVGTLLDEISSADADESFLDQESLSLIVMVRDTPSFVNTDPPEQTAP